MEAAAALIVAAFAYLMATSGGAGGDHSLFDPVIPDVVVEASLPRELDFCNRRFVLAFAGEDVPGR